MLAVLLRGGREVSLLTGDVSFRGLFLRTDDPPPLRQLLQVKLKLPPENDELVAHAMAVFVVPVGAAGQAVNPLGASRENSRAAGTAAGTAP